MTTPFEKDSGRQAVKKLLSQAESTVRERMGRGLVTQEFDGRLRVVPENLYVDHTTGKRALENLRAFAATRGH